MCKYELKLKKMSVKEICYLQNNNNNNNNNNNTNNNNNSNVFGSFFLFSWNYITNHVKMHHFRRQYFIKYFFCNL